MAQPARFKRPHNYVDPSSSIKRRKYLLDSIATNFEDGEYADVKVTCNGREWKVHKAIICRQSPFFKNACKKNALKEGRTTIIDLPADDPDAVNAMLKFLYNAEYDDENQPHNWLLNARVYTIAEKYGIKYLKLEAYAILDRLRVYPGAEDTEDFEQAVKWIWTNTAEDDKVRDLFILAPFRSIHRLLENDDGIFFQRTDELNDYRRDVFRSLRFLFRCRNFLASNQHQVEAWKRDKFGSPVYQDKWPIFKCNDCSVWFMVREDHVRDRLKGSEGVLDCLKCKKLAGQVTERLSRLTWLTCIRCKSCRRSFASSENTDLKKWACCYCGKTDVLLQQLVRNKEGHEDGGNAEGGEDD